jgi:predicted GNAT family acetyltransferase
MSETTETTVRDNPEAGRYEASVDAGVVAGFAEYRDAAGVRVFTHTEVDDAFEGQGVGSALVRGALDDVRERGMRIRVRCPFVKAYLERHDEYADLVADGQDGRVSGA